MDVKQALQTIVPQSKIREKLNSVTTDDLPPSKRLCVCINSESTIAEAFDTLVRERILSAPVYNTTTKTATSMIDMNDILHAAVTLALEADQAAQIMLVMLEAWKSPGVKLPPARELFTSQKVFTTAKVAEIANLSETNPFVSVKRGATLLEVVDLMNLKKVHRVVVLEKDDPTKIASIITQSQILNFVASNLAHFKERADLSIAQLDAYNVWKPMCVVTNDQKAIDAFSLMRKYRVSGVPVVDAQNKVIGCISNRDLRVIGSDAFDLELVFLPVPNFLAKVAAFRAGPATPENSHAVVTFHKSDKFGSLVTKMDQNKVHRVFGVDDNGVLIAIATITDVIKSLAA